MIGQKLIGRDTPGAELGAASEGAEVMGSDLEELKHGGPEASSVPRVANLRELTVDELDVEDMVGNMHLRLGAAWMHAGPHAGYNGERQLSDALWELLPFAKALGRLALENTGRTRELWAQALREPMPFGGAPLGMPTVEARIACAIHGAFEPTQEGACPDCWRSEQIRRGV